MRRGLGFRWLFFFTGLLVLGLGVALTIKGKRFGVGSWDVLHVGLFKQLGLSIGLWSIIMGILIVASASIGLRKWPQIGTFANLASVGLFIDFFNWLIPDPHSFVLEFITFILGVMLLAIGCGIYISADLGAGPRDTLMLLLSEKLNWSITFARTLMEIAVAVIGFLLSGPIGVGTVIIAFALGPIIQVSLRYSRKFLHSKIGKESQAAH
ncbi:YitT family protein [Barrientosiimonas marina]|uniref:YitT family protein n=1 Tax=Lentibacillus kimchii TaxID=1542911 RepID=A0ABW2UTJ8_9BACI